ncbi:hypothetical protein C1752_14316 [Acaryochloris thomasi RCC1774]|uniref:Uncharacterized protein n=1 Tax=Acaryochloris thomasi RCC1774 TaxID=1764569 RepID=A0A2W1J6X3_9CYAN|nr:hypothetical protein [Acaryochloris thomasi]PZD70313.1 hypothetical protein C1752_14316 [Acaryochloris thomasi RCC1774]
MASEDSDLRQRSAYKTAYLFLGGIAVGALTMLILDSFFPVELNALNVGIATIVIVSSGLLSSIFGKSFINALMDILGSSSL